MNSLTRKWLVTATAYIGLLLLATTVDAKKPGKPPPEPEPSTDGAACVESGSFFPAFMYVVSDFGHHGQTENEIFLSNAIGDCRIPIYTTTDVIVPTVSYRLSGNRGKIVWSTREWSKRIASYTPAKILLLEFEIEGGAITTPLPLMPRVILEEPDWGTDGGNVYSPDLSPSGDSVIVSAYQPGEVVGYIWEFVIPDPESGPVEAWNWDVVFSLERDLEEGLERGTLHYPHYGLREDRIYFGFVDYSGRNLAYIQKDSNGWSQEPVIIATREEGLGPSGIGLWDYGYGEREVLAYPHAYGDSDTIEILDVDVCTGLEPEGFCVVVDTIEGFDQANFTTFAEGPLPALMYLYDENMDNAWYSIRECNLESAIVGDSCYRTVIDVIMSDKQTISFIDSAD